jgi:hypothetical protein
MGKGCVRFKSLEDLALDVRFAGRELYGGRPRAVVSWSREAGAAVLVKTGRPHRCARTRRGAHGQLPGGEGAQGEVIRRNAEGRNGSARSDEGFRASDGAHVSGAPEDDGGAGAWESRISRSSRSKLKLLLRPYRKVSDQLGISGSCTAVGYQPLVVRLHTASLRTDWSWAIAVPAIQSVTPLLPN